MLKLGRRLLLLLCSPAIGILAFEARSALVGGGGCLFGRLVLLLFSLVSGGLQILIKITLIILFLLFLPFL